jgi:glycosyltransferase involved in cell wall biosynthesis
VVNKILVHCLGASLGGAIRHLTNFIPMLSACSEKNQYVFLVRDSFSEIYVGENILYKKIPDKQAASWFSRLYYDIVVLPRMLGREGYTAIVSLTNFGPIWSPIPHVFFQRNAVYYCDYYLKIVNRRLKLESMARRFLAIQSMNRADLVVTPSNAMAAMIKDKCPSVRQKEFYTLYHGFSKETLKACTLDESILNVINTTRQKIFYPTHPAVHKGFEILFKLLFEYKKRNKHFVLITTINEEDWPSGIRKYRDIVQKLGLQDEVKFIGRVHQSQMGYIYEHVDCMVYPSLCESFGFSMIEAMGYGLPILAANTDINREICDNAAIYYEPENYREGAEKLALLMGENVRSELENNAKRRVLSRDWGWDRYAREFVEMIEKVCG